MPYKHRSSEGVGELFRGRQESLEAATADQEREVRLVVREHAFARHELDPRPKIEAYSKLLVVEWVRAKTHSRENGDALREAHRPHHAALAVAE